MQPTGIKITIYPKSRSIRLRIDENLKLLISAGKKFSESQIRECILSNWEWIERKISDKIKQQDKIQKILSLHQGEFLRFGKWKILENQTQHGIKLELLNLLETRVKEWARIMKVEYKKISVRLNKRVLGSCSYQNHLSFSLLLYCAPIQLIDYVIIHELSHIRYKDHSKAFWDFLQNFCADHKFKRRILRENMNLYATLFKNLSKI